MATAKKAASSSTSDSSTSSSETTSKSKKEKSTGVYVPGTGVHEVFKGPTTADLNPAYNDPTE